MSPARLILAFAWSLVPLASATAQVGVIPRDVEAYLATAAKFSPTDLAVLEQGTVIARAVSGADDRELVVMAAVKIGPRANGWSPTTGRW